MMTNQLYNRLVRIVHNIKLVYLKITTTKNNYYLFSKFVKVINYYYY